MIGGGIARIGLDQTEFKPFRRAGPFRPKERRAMAHVY